MLPQTLLPQPSNGQGRNYYSCFTDEATEVQVAMDTKKSGLRTWSSGFSSMTGTALLIYKNK